MTPQSVPSLITSATLLPSGSSARTKPTPARGTLSHTSPLARALFGKEFGDTVKVAQSEAEIVEIA